MTFPPPSTGRSTVLVLAALAAAAAPAGGQLSELAVEVGASRVAPPAEVGGDAGRYLVAGARFTRFSSVGSGLNASVLVGRSTDEADGSDYLSAGLDARVWRRVGKGWYLGVEANGFGFEVREPYAYRALAVEGGPAVQFRGRRITGTLRGVLGAGRARTDVLTEVSASRRMHRGDPATQLVTLEEDLWRYGAEAELLGGSRHLAVGLAGGLHHTPAGDYGSVGARLLAGRGGGVAEVRVDYWDTPVGTQATGGLSFVLPLGGWSLRGFFGRSEPDPLTLTEPGRNSGGVLLSRRIAGGPSWVSGPEPLYEIVEVGDEAATVLIKVRAPETAASVQVLGDFTLWEPVAMERTVNGWAISLEAPAGVHHFGFLVDGRWFLPDNAPDAVPDEWGRMNATLVIER